MKTFDVYQHPSRDWQAVKEGFSWPGFFFGTIWCFLKGLWGWGLAFVALAIVLSFVIDSDPILTGISFAVSIAIGSEGNSWRRDRLLQRGYNHIGKVTASNASSAIAEAVERSQENTSATTGNQKVPEGAQLAPRPL